MNFGYFKRSVALIKQEPIFLGFFALYFVGVQFFALSMPKIDPNQVDSMDSFVRTFSPYLLPYLGTILGEVYTGLFVIMLGVEFVRTSNMNVKDVLVRSIMRFARLFLGYFVVMLVFGGLIVGLLYGFKAGMNPIHIVLGLSSGFLAVFAALALMLYIPVAIVYDESVFGAFRRLSSLIKYRFRECVSVLVLTFIIDSVFQVLGMLFGTVPVLGTAIDVGVFSLSSALTTFIAMLFVLDMSQMSDISVLIEDPEDQLISE